MSSHCQGCGRPTYQPESHGSKRSPRRCEGCHYTPGRCRCPAFEAIAETPSTHRHRWEFAALLPGNGRVPLAALLACGCGALLTRWAPALEYVAGYGTDGRTRGYYDSQVREP